MKTALFLLLLIASSAMSRLEAGYAGTFDDGKPQQNTKAPIQDPRRQVSGADRHPVTASAGKTIRTLPLPNNRNSPATRNVLKPPRPFTGRTAMATNSRRRETNAVHKMRPPVQPVTGSHPSTSPPDNCCHHNPNSATLGGSLSPNVSKPGTLNGTRIARKP